MSVHFERATLLLKQHRPRQAEAELRLALSEEPNYAPAHAVLALCLSQRGEHAEATEEAKSAIGLMPNLAFAHYALACVLMNRNRFDEAEKTAESAIQLDPADADNYALLANARLAQKKWTAALEAADLGLSCDAGNIECANLRATALVKLGRKQESEQSLQGTLARDPENADSHTTMGWTLLDRNQPREALEHFREALRISPNSSLAQAGMVEALKARYWIYGLMLRYFLWMAKLSGTAQWAVILGGYFGMRALRNWEKSNPAIETWTFPITIVYVIFVLLTWLADPLFNLLLRLNKYGRYALSRPQVVASNWVGGCLASAILLFGVGWFSDSLVLVLLALVAGLSVLPLSAVFNCSTGWPRVSMILYTALVAVVGLVGAIGSMFDSELSKSAIGLFALGIFASTFVANALVMARPKH